LSFSSGDSKNGYDQKGYHLFEFEEETGIFEKSYL